MTPTLLEWQRKHGITAEAVLEGAVLGGFFLGFLVCTISGLIGKARGLI